MQIPQNLVLFTIKKNTHISSEIVNTAVDLILN